MVTTTGEADLRAEEYERMVKGFALQEFRMKQVVSISTANAWMEGYYREASTELSENNDDVFMIPRLANFPYGEVQWTKVQSYIGKYGQEGVIAWEDAMLDNIDVIARTLLRLSRSVAFAVDVTIYDALYSATGNTVACAAGFEWDSATLQNRDPIQNILDAKRELYIDNFDPDGNETFLILSPAQYANLLGNEKVNHNPSFKTEDVVSNGRVAKICGLKIIVTPIAEDDAAMICIAKECGTWKQASPLTVFTTPDKGVKYTIRAFEMGVCQVTTPNAICTITNVKA